MGTAPTLSHKLTTWDTEWLWAREELWFTVYNSFRLGWELWNALIVSSFLKKKHVYVVVMKAFDSDPAAVLIFEESSIQPTEPGLPCFMLLKCSPVLNTISQFFFSKIKLQKLKSLCERLSVFIGTLTAVTWVISVVSGDINSRLFR